MRTARFYPLAASLCLLAAGLVFVGIETALAEDAGNGGAPKGGSEPALFNCDGTWTNRPCGAGAEPAKPAAEGEDPLGSEQSIAKIERSKKESLFHELTMKAIQAKDEYQLRFDLSEVEKICFSQASTLQECSRAIEEMESKIDEKRARESAIASSKPRESEPPPTSESNVVAVTESGNDGFYRPRRKVTIVDGKVVYETERPYYDHRTTGSAGIVVKGESAAGGTSITVGGSLKSESTSSSKVFKNSKEPEATPPSTVGSGRRSAINPF